MVVDASSLIVFLRRESGYDRVAAGLEQQDCFLSTVSRTEVLGKLVGSGHYTENQIRETLQAQASVLKIAPFDAAQSDLAAFWYARRRPYNLSLGDCACLALAESRGIEVLTAEAAWAGLPNLRVSVHLIR